MRVAGGNLDAGRYPEAPESDGHSAGKFSSPAMARDAKSKTRCRATTKKGRPASKELKSASGRAIDTVSMPYPFGCASLRDESKLQAGGSRARATLTGAGRSPVSGRLAAGSPLQNIRNTSHS
jgi:hypothetical protein